jgi:outer membrane receptor for ferrienterochelin and colicins
MKTIINIIISLTILITTTTAQQRLETSITGKVTSGGESLAFANLIIEGTTIGAVSDEEGRFQIINVPSGSHNVRVFALGFEPSIKAVEVIDGLTSELNFDLKSDVIGLSEVVITGDRNEKNRRESGVIVNTITPKLFQATQSIILSEGLNYCSGLRMENNCNNCGFSQVRINGLEGPYSQILINSRPIFSGLAGVYGLELIPSNMIERVEVVRGGGSALYGSNAIGGTINLILKDPIMNVYEIGMNGGAVGTGIKGSGSQALDFSTNINASVVSPDNKTGLALYGFFRDRQPFDANDDGFSELTTIKNNTFGSRVFQRLGNRGKVAGDFFIITEDRRGGDKFESLKHEANVTEAVNHNIINGAVTYEQFFRKSDLFTAYISALHVERDSYYGAEQSLKDYGNTKSMTINSGLQYVAKLANTTLTAGIENRSENLRDKKLGYPDFENATIENGEIIEIPHVDDLLVADQVSITTGFYAQYEYNLPRWQFSAGARYENYSIKDLDENGGTKTGNVITPRVTVKYDATRNLQLRLSYAEGYRAPQIFDEDLHIETSGSRQVLHRNDPNLKQETSHSFMASADYTFFVNNSTQINVLAEGFYTMLTNPFVNEFGEPDDNGVVVYTRTNAAKGAVVRGINLEANVAAGKNFFLNGGFTIQNSTYEEEQEFDEKAFFKSPDSYGFLTVDNSLGRNTGISATINYTGSMLIPYFGNTIADPEAGELRKTDNFLDLGLKFRYNIKINGATLQLFAGVKNVFNSYQNDFDYGIDRDPGYVYGPMEPRTIYAGLKFGNVIR